ncbi:MAG: acetylglutamate kinase [Elusimicrobia bacterium]|nr:acetylglutamate kinase [Candidatus Liberimonas magnetica]
MAKKINVIKFGGSLSKNRKAWNRFLDDIAVLSKKSKYVIIHGGGPEINAWLDKLNIKTKFINGLRYTDEKTLEVVEMVLSGKVNKTIVSELLKRKVNAVGISCKDGFTCIAKKNKKLGLVGEPLKVNTGLLNILLKNGYLPVISSLAISEEGETLNVNADSIAMAVSKALKAEKLILLTDVEGILDRNNETIRSIRSKDIKGLIKSNVVTGGMIPKVQACFDSIRCGIKQVWIVSGVLGIKKLKGTLITK